MKTYSKYSPLQLKIIQSTALPVNCSRLNQNITQLRSDDSNFQKLMEKPSKTQRNQRESPIKINFLYGNSTNKMKEQNQNLKQVNNRNKSLLKNHQKQPKKFMNIISRQNLPKQIMDFVYGTNQKRDEQIRIDLSSDNTQQAQSDKQQNQQKTLHYQKLVSPIKKLTQQIEEYSFESILNSKIRKSKSKRKESSQQKSFRGNDSLKKFEKLNTGQTKIVKRLDCHPQQSTQINDLKQQGIYLRNSLQKVFQFNDTVKLNIGKQQKPDERFLSTAANLQKSNNSEQNTDKTLHSETFDQEKTYELNYQNKDEKNLTKKVSEFFICQEMELGQNQKNNASTKQLIISLAQQTSKDLNIFKNDNDLNQPSSLNSHSYQQQINEYEKVPIFQISLDDLKQSIKQQSQIQNIYFNKNSHTHSNQQFKNINIYQKLQSNLNFLDKNIHQLTNTVKQICKQNSKQKNTQQKQIITQYFNQFLQENTKTNQIRYLNQSQTTQQCVDLQNAKLIKLNTIKQISQIQSEVNLFGSLVVINPTHKIINIDNKFSHIYQISSSNTQHNHNLNQIQTSQPNHLNYPDHLFPESQNGDNKILNQQISTQRIQQNQSFEHYSTNVNTSKNYSSNKEYSQPTIQNQKMRFIPNHNQIMQRNQFQNKKIVKKQQNIKKPEIFVDKRSFSQRNHLTSPPKLNYEMYKTYRQNNMQKKQCKLIQHKKQFRYVQLPYMDRPTYQKDQQQTKCPKYIKNKTYYVRV